MHLLDAGMDLIHICKYILAPSRFFKVQAKIPLGGLTAR